MKHSQAYLDDIFWGAAVAIFSLNHSLIGHGTHPSGAPSLYARYATGQNRCTEIINERMPDDWPGMMKWLDHQEQEGRKNTRVIDKVVVALPLELTHEQNLSLLLNFCERMTERRASCAAAVHDGPKGFDYPHANIIFRDRGPETSKRVMLTTERGSTEQFREGWEQEANISLEKAGHEVRIDRRSLADQGIDREPQLHVAPASEARVRKEPRI
ncbi:MobA/MobL family protein [Bradyrhizobium sp. SRS-191]|uniref:MobA/MobL family protein n=1 Tax=Bradyrhizobium sp. SRS-191 TaxID=2962606 RepID=UPI00211DF3A0|nr:MobA/MobL family protein [Bradyrhizobium sp. SRS-191]